MKSQSIQDHSRLPIKPPMQLDQIHTSIIDKILAPLGYEELVNLGATNRSFREICQQKLTSESLARTFVTDRYYLAYPSKVISEVDWQALAYWLPKIEKTTIATLKPSLKPRNARERRKIINTANLVIRDIELGENLSSKQFRKLQKALSNLKREDSSQKFAKVKEFFRNVNFSIHEEFDYRNPGARLAERIRESSMITVGYFSLMFRLLIWRSYNVF